MYYNLTVIENKNHFIPYDSFNFEYDIKENGDIFRNRNSDAVFKKETDLFLSDVYSASVKQIIDNPAIALLNIRHNSPVIKGICLNILHGVKFKLTIIKE